MCISFINKSGFLMSGHINFVVCKLQVTVADLGKGFYWLHPKPHEIDLKLKTILCYNYPR